MIRTYELSHESKTPLYVQLYEAIRADILSGSLPGGEKLPSKRALAEHLSLSKITVETAYAQLLDEGYLTSRERSGYFVAHMPLLAKAPARHTPETTKAPEIAPRQNAAAELFPFSVWAKLMRSVILDEGQYLLQPVPNGGLLPLRRAIAGELARQRLRGWTKDAFRLSGITQVLLCTTSPSSSLRSMPPLLVGEALAYHRVFGG